MWFKTQPLFNQPRYRRSLWRRPNWLRCLFRSCTCSMSPEGAKRLPICWIICLITVETLGAAATARTGGSPAWEKSYLGAYIPAMPQTLYWSAIYLADDKEVQVLLSLPDGSELQIDAWLREGSCTTMRYEIVPGAPLGTYKLELRQGDVILVDTFDLEMPVEPVQVEFQRKPLVRWIHAKRTSGSVVVLPELFIGIPETRVCFLVQEFTRCHEVF